jgi:hypothetical protein
VILVLAFAATLALILGYPEWVLGLASSAIAWFTIKAAWLLAMSVLEAEVHPEWDDEQ